MHEVCEADPCAHTELRSIQLLTWRASTMPGAETVFGECQP